MEIKVGKLYATPWAVKLNKTGNIKDGSMFGYTKENELVLVLEVCSREKPGSLLKTIRVVISDGTVGWIDLWAAKPCLREAVI